MHVSNNRWFAAALLCASLSAQQPTRLEIAPGDIRLDDGRDRQRVIAIVTHDDGTTRDVTDAVEWALSSDVHAALQDAELTPRADGECELSATFGKLTANTTVTVANTGKQPPVSFANEVIPVLTRSGCNAGTCHGSASGKNGFGLSLFGFDRDGDHRKLTRELRGRRIDTADPDASLILLKPTGGVPHKGGKRLTPDGEGYATLRRWIEAGARNDVKQAPELVGLELFPEQAVLAGPDLLQRVVVRARYSDGSDRDVTDLSILSSSNEVAATVNANGVIRSAEPGETFVMARYGTFALVTQVLVLPKDVAFTWPGDVEPANYIDASIFDKLGKQRIAPAARCDDATFVRRVYLDVLNLLPTPDETRRFLADDNPNKRVELVDALLERPEFPDVWAMQWAEILRIEPEQLEPKGMYVYHDWLRDAFQSNRPLDEIVRELLTSKGGNFEQPQSNFYLVERSTKGIAENVAQVFMGIRIQCAQCHNHPFERWTMDDYYGFAAFFNRVRSKRGEDPRERIVFVTGGGELANPVTGVVAKPTFLGGATPEIKRGQDRRAVVADWLTAGDNPFFAKNIANRVFARFFGRGVVDPPDDVRVSNPPSHPELYEQLGTKLVEYGYDLRQLIRDICASHSYQAAAHPDAPPASTFAGVNVRRLTAEQLLDAISDVTQVPTKYDRLPLGARATQVVNPTGNRFLGVFGRPARESACTCDRRNEPTLSQVLHLINGATTTAKLRDDKGRLRRLLASKDVSDDAVLDELFLAAYSRMPTDGERDKLLQKVRDGDRATNWEDVFWAILNSREFLFTH